MSIADLAGLIPATSRLGSAGQSREPDLGFHQGLVQAWDSATQQNTIIVAGTPIPDVPVLSTADSILLTQGDVVGLLRFKTTYFILGRIALPGVSRALGMQVGFNALFDGTTSTSFVSLNGPLLDNVFVGSSRRCLVLATAAMSVGAGNIGFFGIKVGGASGINPAEDGILTNNTAVVLQSTITGIHLFDADDGLNQGTTTFEMVYRVGNGAAGATSFFNRTIIAIPF